MQLVANDKDVPNRKRLSVEGVSNGVARFGAAIMTTLESAKLRIEKSEQ